MPDTIERLQVAIEANIKPLLDGTEKGIDQVQRQLKETEKTGKKAFDTIGDSAEKADANFQGMGKTLKTLTTVAKGFFAVFVIEKITGFFRQFNSVVKESVDLTKEQIRVESQLDATLRSTGNAAGLTAKEIKEMASGLQSVTNFGDEATIAGQNILLTFTKIGRDIFPRATEAMLDVSTALGTDLKSSAIQVGKALNDPVKGLDALSRAGIQFSERQKDLIKSLADSNRLSEAQAIILDELETQFGGSARAAREADGGVIAFGNAVGDLQELLGLPVFEQFGETSERLLDVLSRNQPEIEDLATAIGELVAKISDFLASGFVDALESIDTGSVKELLNTLDQTVDTVKLLAESTEGISFNSMIEGVNSLIGKLNEALFTLAQINAMVEAEEARRAAINKSLADSARAISEREGRSGVGEFGAFAVENIPFVSDIFQGLGSAGLLDDESQAAILEAQAAGQEAYTEAILNALPAFDAYEQAQDEKIALDEESASSTDILSGALDKNSDTLNTLSDEQQELIKKFGIQLIELQNQVNQELQALQEEHAERMIEIDEAEKEARADINEKFNQRLADQTKRILEDAQEDLENLENETDRRLADERRDFQREEKRETEDHLKEMRRIRRSFLGDLETIVAGRDAIALVNRRKQFQEERRAEKESFEIDRTRDKEDFDQELADLRENEDRRAQEIINAREKALARLQETTDAARQRELERSEEKFQEQRDRENEQFNERETELNESLARQLEAIALNLANQGEITEEGAAAVLGILSDHFGQGGLIDTLMEAFRKRVAELGTLRIDINASLDPTGLPPAPPTNPNQPPAPFADGGVMMARPPGRLALVGEKVPELFGAMPINQLNNAARDSSHQFNFAGSAPPGIMNNDRDQLASILVQAMREAGFR